MTDTRPSWADEVRIVARDLIELESYPPRLPRAGGGMSTRRIHAYDVTWHMSVEVQLPAHMDPDCLEAHDLASLAAADVLRADGPQVEDVAYLGPVEREAGRE